MKRLTLTLVAVAVSLVAVLATPERGKHKGWPNAGILEPGSPRHYASPRAHQHP